MYESQKILLLDDNKDLLQIVQIILKGQGYETVLATCVDEALKKIKIHRPVLMLVDICINDQDGCELCDRLKHDRNTQDIKIIMMSGSDSNMDHMPEIGADDFMLKPFDYNDLVGKVQKHMRHFRHAYA